MSAIASAATILSAGGAGAAEAVQIPPEYVHDPALGSLHDYCTSSPDQPSIHDDQWRWQAVDFRGPCARHDLCYEGSATKQVCDDAFRVDLERQCEATFGADLAGYLARCRQTAEVYHAAVLAFGDAGP